MIPAITSSGFGSILRLGIVVVPWWFLAVLTAGEDEVDRPASIPEWFEPLHQELTAEQRKFFRFEEKRISPLSRRERILNGVLERTPKHGVVLNYLEPTIVRIHISAEQITVEEEGRADRVVSPEEDEARMLHACLHFDWVYLQQVAEVSLTGNAEAWRVAVLPSEESDLNRIEIHGSGGALTQLQLHGRAGASRQFTFTPILLPTEPSPQP